MPPSVGDVPAIVGGEVVKPDDIGVGGFVVPSKPDGDNDVGTILPAPPATVGTPETSIVGDEAPPSGAGDIVVPPEVRGVGACVSPPGAGELVAPPEPRGVGA